MRACAVQLQNTNEIVKTAPSLRKTYSSKRTSDSDGAESRQMDNKSTMEADEKFPSIKFAIRLR
jgi:hypothetical protein